MQARMARTSEKLDLVRTLRVNMAFCWARRSYTPHRNQTNTLIATEAQPETDWLDYAGGSTGSNHYLHLPPPLSRPDCTMLLALDHGWVLLTHRSRSQVNINKKHIPLDSGLSASGHIRMH